MWTRNRRLRVVVAAGYVLALLTAALVHNHADNGHGCCGGGCDEHSVAVDCRADDSHHGHQREPGHGTPDRHPTHDSKCAACQFLAEKPSLIEVVSPVGLAALVQAVAILAPARSADNVFSAWQSRAPPAFA